MIARAVRYSPRLVNELVNKFGPIQGDYAKETELLDLLNEACQKDQMEAVAALIKAGIAPLVPGKPEVSCTIVRPLQTAIVSGHLYIAQKLIASGYVYDASAGQDVDLQKLLPGYVNLSDQWRTALCIYAKCVVSSEMVVTACQNRNYEMVSMLVKTDKRTIQSPSSSKTPLHAAIEAGVEAIIKLLVSNGAPLNSGDCLENLPLMVAARKRDVSLCRGLVEAKASLQYNGKSIIPAMKNINDFDIVVYVDKLEKNLGDRI